MCGIVGYWNTDCGTLDMGARERIGRMTDMLRHRGPDSGDVWLDPQAGLALGHRRLAILDLSPAGHQPMVSACGRYAIVYNGEVYNSAELRDELEVRSAGPRIAWRGHSDTETILEACAAWGVERTVERLIGMFAFALWDRRERTLTLVRDRMGVKPLYWGLFGQHVMFSSEIKPFHLHPAFRPEIDRDALTAFVHFCYVPDPHCIFKKLHKLEPGTLAIFRPGGTHRIVRYWNALEEALAGISDRLPADDDASAEAALDKVHTLLRDAVRRRMMADVPLGAFLSGGIDSSLVVALMQEAQTSPVRTFSIGFHEAAYNEAPYAKAVAEHLGTDHTEFYVTPQEALDVIPRLPDMYDEPFADSSQVPTFLVSELASRHVTIALSGDGGDELFAGYARYFNFRTAYGAQRRLPRPLRHALIRVAKLLSPLAMDLLARALPSQPGIRRRLERLGALAGALCSEPGELYRRFVTHWPKPEDLVRDGRLPDDRFGNASIAAAVQDDIELMQYLDVVTYLPGDILTKVDRASMAVSLEARVPLLDHRIYAQAWRLPPALRRRDGQGKWPLRRLLQRYVPAKLVERPKMGFGVPIDAWLRGPLRPWAEHLLDEKRLREEGFFDASTVRACWQRHLAGEGWHYWLWDILMFQAWQERYLRA